MAFVKGKKKTGGRKVGTRNKINMFNQETIELAKLVIAEKVAQGDIEASKLVLNYSLSKPASHQIGLLAELEQIKAKSQIDFFTEKEKEDTLFDFLV